MRARATRDVPFGRFRPCLDQTIGIGRLGTWAISHIPEDGMAVFERRWDGYIDSRRGEKSTEECLAPAWASAECTVHNVPVHQL